MAGETILITDDSEENRDFLVEYVLEPNGYKALTARDGQEGLELAIKYEPDLILLDYNMPRLDGAGVLKALRDRGLDIPVILMTFYGSEDIAVEVFRLGVRDYVAKPFYPEDMERAIDSSLTEIRLRREKDALTERVIQANRDLQMRLQELNVLYGIGKSVTTLMSMDKLLPRVVDAAIQLTNAEEGHIYLIEGDHLLCLADKRVNNARAKRVNDVSEDPVAIEVVRTGKALSLGPEDAQSLGPNAPVSAVYTPLALGKDVIGVMGIGNVSAESEPFSQHETALLSALSDYVTIAITNSRHYESLKQAKDNETDQIRDAFERFVAPSVVERALEKPDDIKPGGSRQEISVLFADIRGYTSWSEDADPEAVIETLNHYLSLAAEVIMSWGARLISSLATASWRFLTHPNPNRTMFTAPPTRPWP